MQNDVIGSNVPWVTGVTETTEFVEVAVHPVPTVTKKVPLLVTVILLEVAPVFQALPVFADEVKVIVPP